MNADIRTQLEEPLTDQDKDQLLLDILCELRRIADALERR